MLLLIWKSDFRIWVGGVADSQKRSKPLKPPPPNHSENRRLKPEFHLSRSQISQEPQVGWIGPRIWENFAQKTSLPKVANKQTLWFYRNVPCLILHNVQERGNLDNRTVCKWEYSCFRPKKLKKRATRLTLVTLGDQKESFPHWGWA